jgi:putative tryptophan/tyrosine transport system substrate-binding protein
MPQCPLLAHSGHGLLHCEHLLMTQSGYCAVAMAYSISSGVLNCVGKASLGGGMRRREFLALVGGFATALPTVTWGQPANSVRRIGVLLAATSDDLQYQSRLKAFGERLAQLGWTEGHNLKIDVRWGGGHAELTRQYAAELAALAPDIILASGNATVTPLLQATRTIPVVFAVVADPVGSGYAATLSRPGGNATGFMQFEYGLTGKWLELLHQIAPQVRRVAVFRDLIGGVAQFAVIQSIAPSLGVEASPFDMRDAGEIERAVVAFAHSGNGGLIVTASAFANVHRGLLITLAAQHKLPAIYFARYFVEDGGLVSYGTDLVEQFRQAATYCVRILKGEKPADMPVQAPTKYDLVINLKTAKALGLALPPSLLARANAVIE